MMKPLLAILTGALLALTAFVTPAQAAAPNSDLEIVYEYSDPYLAPVPGTFTTVNYSPTTDYWLCVKYTQNGMTWSSVPFHLDPLTGPYPSTAPGHPLTGTLLVDPGTTIYLYSATASTCLKQKLDTFRVPRA